MSSLVRRAPAAARLLPAGALIASPAVAIFLATNLANAGNLLFNMVFSRVLNPAEFHDLTVVLTIKLAILSIFGAVQMASAQMVARGPEQEPSLSAMARLHRKAFLILFVAAPVVLSFAMADMVTHALGLGSSRLLPILALALPVTAPLCIARGAAQGRISVRAMVLSANLEMIVRLAGAYAAWAAGLGLEGIVGAIALSLVAGWLPVRDDATRQIGARPAAESTLALRLAVLAWPFAVLQVAQVFHLDADLLMSAAVLSSHDADLIAALSLIQRVQFYACFGLAGVLLPTIITAVQQGRPVLPAATPIFALVLGVGAALAVASSIAPEFIVTTVAGPAYAGAAPEVLSAVTAAFAFTCSYLAATLLAALSDRRGIALVVLALPFATAAIWAAGQSGGIEAMLHVKALAQLILMALSALLVAYALKTRHGRKTSA
jgi:O-antigen/teichoic acid export membrane protein